MTKLDAGLLIAVAMGAVAAPIATQPPGSSASQPPTFKSGAEYVEVDVVVTNPQGRYVRDLTKNDFRIFEDGKAQPVTTFGLVDIAIEKYDRPQDAGQPIESDVITNEHSIDGRVYVLVLDDLHIAPLWIKRTQSAAKQFIQRLGANDVMAVVRTSGQDGASHAFTNNKGRLIAAVDRTTGHGLESATAERNQNPGATFDIVTDDLDELQRAANAQTTLQVLRDVSNWVATLHGRRKAILFLSAGLDYPMTDVDYEAGQNRPWDVVLHAAREAIDAATRSNVSIYGIDPGGLSGPDDIGVNYVYGANNRAVGPRASHAELRLQQGSLRWLSEQTGGIAVVGRNDLGAAYDRIVSDNSTYYVLAYAAPNNRRDGKFHKISVRVNRAGLTTRARSGYLSPKDKEPATPPTRDPAGPSRELRDALASPLPVSGLTMRVALAPFKGVAPNASVLITEDLRGRELQLGAPDTLELSYVAMDATGKVRAGNNDRLQLMALKADTRAQIEQCGLRMFNRMSLAPGRYAVRMATHDQGGGALGSVVYDLEVPDFYALPLSMSGLVVTSLVTGRMVVAKADAQMKEVLPAPPIAERAFPQNDQVWLFAEVYDNTGNTPHVVTIATTVTAETGTVVYQVASEHPSSEFSGAKGTFRYRTRVPLNDLEPGAYVMTVQARAHQGLDGTASQKVPITVTAAEK